jgi:hypothetical protein
MKVPRAGLYGECRHTVLLVLWGHHVVLLGTKSLRGAKSCMRTHSYVAVQKNSLPLWNADISYMFTGARHWSLCRASWNHCSPLHCISCKVHFIIILPSSPNSRRSSFPFTFPCWDLQCWQVGLNCVLIINMETKRRKDSSHTQQVSKKWTVLWTTGW